MKHTDYAKTYERGFFQRVKVPLALIQAVDEPWSEEAKAAVEKK